MFVEKPTGHTVNESRAMLKATRGSGRVVQVGLHRRIGAASCERHEIFEIRRGRRRRHGPNFSPIAAVEKKIQFKQPAAGKIDGLEFVVRPCPTAALQ